MPTTFRRRSRVQPGQKLMIPAEPSVLLAGRPDRPAAVTPPGRSRRGRTPSSPSAASPGARAGRLSREARRHVVLRRPALQDYRRLAEGLEPPPDRPDRAPVPGCTVFAARNRGRAADRPLRGISRARGERSPREICDRTRPPPRRLASFSWQSRPPLGPRAGPCTPAGVLASLRTAAVFGLDVFAVHVEVDVSFGLPSFTMVGLPDPSVRESRDRVRSAIRNSRVRVPSAPRHGEPRPGRRAQGRLLVRPPDRPGRPGGRRHRRPEPRSRHRAARGAVARREHPSGPRRAAGRGGRAARGTARDPAAERQRRRGGGRRSRWKCSPVDSLAEAVAAINGADGSARARPVPALAAPPRPARPISRRYADRRWRGGRWRSRRRAGTTS